MNNYRDVNVHGFSDTARQFTKVYGEIDDLKKQISDLKQIIANKDKDPQ